MGFQTETPKQNLGSELSFQRFLREDRGIRYPKIYEKTLFPLTYYFPGKRPFYGKTFLTLIARVYRGGTKKKKNESKIFRDTVGSFERFFF